MKSSPHNSVVTRAAQMLGALRRAPMRATCWLRCNRTAEVRGAERVAVAGGGGHLPACFPQWNARWIVRPDSLSARSLDMSGRPLQQPI